LVRAKPRGSSFELSRLRERKFHGGGPKPATSQ
jgi:hypothetical protein